MTSKHDNDKCTIPYCEQCLANIKQVATMGHVNKSSSSVDMAKLDVNPQPDTWLNNWLLALLEDPSTLAEAKQAIQSKLKAAELAGRISELEKFNSDVLEIEKIGGGWLSDDIAEFAKQVLECNEERLEALRKEQPFDKQAYLKSAEATKDVLEREDKTA